MVELIVFAGVSFFLAWLCLATLAFFLARFSSTALTQANALQIMAKMSQEIDDRVKARVKVVNTSSTPSGLPVAGVGAGPSALRSLGSDELVEEQPPDLEAIRREADAANRWLNSQQAAGIDLRSGDVAEDV